MSLPKLVGLVFVLLVCGSTPAEDTPPNIILIISDDQAWTDFGFMGHPNIETPHLDRLARESRVFPRGYVPASLCCPSLATIITGRYAFEHGITGNEPPRPPTNGTRNNEQYQSDVRAMIDLIDESPTLPALLGERGYRSFQSGKWWLGSYARGGFTHGMTHGDPARGGRHGDAGLTIGRDGMEPIFDFIEVSGDEPFFVWYAPFLPHTPHNPPKRLLEKYVSRTESIHVARYWAMCEWFDETCGQLLDYLDANALAENTIVLFVTDNGWIQRPDRNGYAARSKRTPYEGGVRTPIMVRWPGHVVPGVIDTPVSSIDLAPTILRACGVAVPETMPGVDLLDGAAVAGRKAIFGDVYLHNAIDLHDPGANLTHRWCIHDGWKLIVPNPVNRPEGVIELYDVKNDPRETENVASDHPERVDAMTKLLDEWWDGASSATPGHGRAEEDEPQARASGADAQT